MINKELIRQKFASSVNTYEEESVAQQHIAQKMAQLLAQHLPASCFKQIVELGCGTGYYSRLLIRRYGEDSLILNDLCPEMLDYCHRQVSEKVRLLPGDAESVQLPRHTSLLTSCSAFQWFEHPGDFFRHSQTALSRGGYLAFSTFGPDNAKEVRELSGKGLHYLGLEEWKRLIEPYFDLCYAEEERLSYCFSSPLEVLRHLKKTGVTGLGDQPMSCRELHRFLAEYNHRFRVGQEVTLTYHPVYLIARKKEQRAYVSASPYLHGRLKSPM